MPYIITTKAHPQLPSTLPSHDLTGKPIYVTSRRAVATLDEVHHTQLMALGPGEPVTLPDGTVIEVESVSYTQLEAMLPTAAYGKTIGQSNAHVLAAFNEAQKVTERLEYLRGQLRAERISYGELAELADLAKHIEPGDVELLEAAGVPEFE